MGSAAQALNAGRADEARRALHESALSHPGQPDLQHLYGVACWRGGDLGGAEAAIRKAVSTDRRRVLFVYDLARVLLDQGRDKEAERELRAVLALDRRHEGAVATLAAFFNERGRAAEALQCTTPLLARPGASEAVLSAHAEALRRLGRQDERLRVCERAARAYPESPTAAHNVAAAEADLGRAHAAEAAARSALTKGSDAPETWLVLGRSLLAQSRLDDAEKALDAALRRRPLMVEAHREIAQLIWMRSGSHAEALERLNRAIESRPETLPLHLLKIQTLANMGQVETAKLALSQAARTCSGSVALETAAARLLVKDDPAAALRHAEAATAFDASNYSARMALCETYLGAGRAREAEAVAAALRQERPDDQHVLAYQATAWRVLDDPRYRQLYDYTAFVRSFRVEAPSGWGSRQDFLQAVRTALLGLHTLAAHPFDQSLRGGSQTPQRLDAVEDPAIQAVFAAIDEPIRQYVAELGPGKDPLRSRRSGGYRVAGAWSVRLHPNQGRHVDHVHQLGWISSAFYVDVPDIVDAGGQAGWIKFGEPGTPTHPALGPEHAVKPENGTLVLFPSYMWHGTRPFGGDRPRLTMAFDFTPARPSRRETQTSA